MKMDDLYQHPHDRGELTAVEVAQLVEDYELAGRPDDVNEFLARTFPWRDLPASVFSRTFQALDLLPKP